MQIRVDPRGCSRPPLNPSESTLLHAQLPELKAACGGTAAKLYGADLEPRSATAAPRLSRDAESEVMRIGLGGQVTTAGELRGMLAPGCRWASAWS